MKKKKKNETHTENKKIWPWVDECAGSMASQLASSTVEMKMGDDRSLLI